MGMQRRGNATAAGEEREAVGGNLIGKPDEEVDTEGSGDLVGKVRADGPALGICAAKKPALVPTERLRVVAVSRSRGPVRGLGGEDRIEGVRIGGSRRAACSKPGAKRTPLTAPSFW